MASTGCCDGRTRKGSTLRRRTRSRCLTQIVGIKLHEWLRDHALVARQEYRADSHEEILKNFGSNSPSYEREIDTLRALYKRFSGYETVAVKRRLWHDLLRTALGRLLRGMSLMIFSCGTRI